MITVDDIKASQDKILKDFLIKIDNKVFIINPFLLRIETRTSKTTRVRRFGELHGMTMKNCNYNGFWKATNVILKKQKKD